MLLYKIFNSYKKINFGRLGGGPRGKYIGNFQIKLLFKMKITIKNNIF